MGRTAWDWACCSSFIKKNNFVKYSCFSEEDFTSSGLTRGQQHSDCRLHPDLGISLIRMKMASAARVLTESSGSFAKGRRAAREGSRADMTPHCLQRPPGVPSRPWHPAQAPSPAPPAPPRRHRYPAASACSGSSGAMRQDLAANAVVGTGARLAEEEPWGLWPTDEPDGHLWQGGLSVPQVRQPLPEVFFHPLPVVH